MMEFPEADVFKQPLHFGARHSLLVFVTFHPITACHLTLRKTDERPPQPSAPIAKSRSSPQLPIRRTQPHLGYEVINLGVGHLFVGPFPVARREIVDTNIRAAADAKHAEEE